MLLYGEIQTWFICFIDHLRSIKPCVWVLPENLRCCVKAVSTELLQPCLNPCRTSCWKRKDLLLTHAVTPKLVASRRCRSAEFTLWTSPLFLSPKHCHIFIGQTTEQLFNTVSLTEPWERCRVLLEPLCVCLYVSELYIVFVATETICIYWCLLSEALLSSFTELTYKITSVVTEALPTGPKSSADFWLAASFTGKLKLFWMN